MEQYMMYQKAVMFGDGVSAAKILQATIPHEQKMLGRGVQGFKGDVWYNNCNHVIKRGLHAKFTQNPQLRRYLLNTGRETLAEASPFDAIWGIGLSQDDPRARQPHLWRGENRIGILLMENLDLVKEEELLPDDTVLSIMLAKCVDKLGLMLFMSIFSIGTAVIFSDMIYSAQHDI